MNEKELDRIIDQVIAQVRAQQGPAESTPGTTNLAAYIDHTLLKPNATRDQILTLCDEAKQYGFATVCINPYWVKTASERLFGSSVGVCTVAGFPLGSNTTCIKVEETKRAVSDGASEVDMVINVGMLKTGDLAFIYRDIHRIVEAAGDAGVKVIIETCLLTDEEKITACTIAKEAGARFVKTSTGFSTAGATVEDVALMRRVVGPDMGVKAAGGIRDRAAAEAMIRAGASRIGASASIKIVSE